MRIAVNVHASCVRLGSAASAFQAPSNAGVLLIGESGSGKSDLALRLISRGAQLVADDRTDLCCERGQLVARPPARIAGFIEIRGVGIILLPHAQSARIALVVDLSAKGKRLPERQYYSPAKSLQLPAKARPALLALGAFEPSAPDKIIAAVAALRHNASRATVKSN